MTQVLIVVGSNLNKETNLPAAVRLVAAHPHMELLAESPVLATPALGPTGLPAEQPEFHNAALLVETDLDPGPLRAALRAIELQLGRARTADKFAPRPIDLDIAYYGDRTVVLDGKPIPAPDVLRFAYIAIPLAAIAPFWRHPETGASLATIAAHFGGAVTNETGDTSMPISYSYSAGNGGPVGGSATTDHAEQPSAHTDRLRDAHAQEDAVANSLLQAAPEQLRRAYDAEFRPNASYLASLPDLQNGPASLIQGSSTTIQQVGIHNFRLPLRYAQRTGDPLLLETAVTGTVSLAALHKGINMSRVIRTLYEHKDAVFDLEMLGRVLDSYRRELGSLEAQLVLRFSYPILNESLRSGLIGYQYYEVALEAHMDQAGAVRKYIHFDFVYSSTCPCSYELAQHAIQTRHVAAVAHSQRSVARISVELDGPLTIEALRDLCLAALNTETQVMVKREDEQAFAELSAAHLKFVEDAVRLLHYQLDGHPSIRDFKVIASHQESLHSHDAVSVIVKGIPGGFRSDLDPNTLATLIHR